MINQKSVFAYLLSHWEVQYRTEDSYNGDKKVAWLSQIFLTSSFAYEAA